MLSKHIDINPCICHHHYGMRTTINIDDDIFEILQKYAEDRSVALGKAASDLMRKGLNTPVSLQLKNGFYTVVLPADTPKVTSEDVKRLLEDET
jgi:hypothetical protein